MLKVKDEPDLVRLPGGAIQNTNQDEYRLFIARRNAMLSDKKRIEQLEKDTAEVKDMLGSILAILKDKK